MSGFKCLECGKKFKTTRAAEKAASDGCPQCGGVDIDLDTGGEETFFASEPGIGFYATRACENSGQ